MLDGRGLTGGPAIDWPALMARKRGFTEPVAARIEESAAATGAETMHGRARLLGAGRLEVDGRAFDAANIVVASGARPLPLGIPGEELMTISDEFLELDDLPPRVVFIGGGYISFEFAWLSRMAGAAVTILHRGDTCSRASTSSSPMCSPIATARWASTSSPARRSPPCTGGRRAGRRPAPETSPPTSSCTAPDASPISPAWGWPRPASRRLPGVRVDEHLRSVSAAHVWAAGDAADIGLPLTPVASKQGKVVAGGILGEDAAYDGAPCRACASATRRSPPSA